LLDPFDGFYCLGNEFRLQGSLRDEASRSINSYSGTPSLRLYPASLRNEDTDNTWKNRIAGPGAFTAGQNMKFHNSGT
jgi:hypothetical protein